MNRGDYPGERLAGEYYCEQMLQLYIVMIVMMMILMLNSDDINYSDDGNNVYNESRLIDNELPIRIPQLGPSLLPSKTNTCSE